MKKRSDYSTEELVNRWEDQRAVRNLMGRMTQEILFRGEARFFDEFWSCSRSDVSLGLNEGWYLGPDAIRAYYVSVAEETVLSDQVLRQRFPAQTGAGYGLGQFDLKPLSSDLVEIAEDGQTAKGMWSCQGSDIRMTPQGPLSYWTVGVYAADFVLEDGQWRLWHLLELRDIDCPCGEQWWKARKAREPEPGFEALAAAGRPTPTVPEQLHSLWTLEQAGGLALECPQPYSTFAETFSYGYEGGEADAG